jgi:zinc transport system substrate-binding protein
LKTCTKRLLPLLALLYLVGCGESGPDSSSAETAIAELPRVATVNYPLAWAAEQLCLDTAEVYFPVPPGVDPASWQPQLEELAAYQHSALILLSGADYARWVAKASLPANRLWDTSRNFSADLIETSTGPVHSHGPQGDHSHGEQAFTVWLDLNLYRQQIETMTEALREILPAREAVLDWRRDAMVSELGVMDEGLREIGEDLDGAPLLYSHPVYQYLDRAYDLNGVALHWEPQQVPGADDFQKLDQLLGKHPAQLMLWEDEPLAATRQQLADRGIEVVVFRPLANRPPHGDFTSEMTANIARLKRYLVEHEG